MIFLFSKLEIDARPADFAFSSRCNSIKGKKDHVDILNILKRKCKTLILLYPKRFTHKRKNFVILHVPIVKDKFVETKIISTAIRITTL